MTNAFDITQKHRLAGPLALTTGNPPEDRSLFYLKPSAPRRLPAVRPVRCLPPAPQGSASPAKYTYIDAFSGETVTRETLLRYTFKSRRVNVLIRANVWKTAWQPSNLAVTE
jgi:hypothetical protein